MPAIRFAIPALVAKWEPLIGVKVGRVFVQRMKTQWGSCRLCLNKLLRSRSAQAERDA
ncbi:M48 family metallopeptidase [Ralstonia solanacearum]|uniref:M48 metallopeptidase family protein n=1 Tax=Ralstonia solanacearum TaxID=305 RepID=UPI003CC546D7